MDEKDRDCACLERPQRQKSALVRPRPELKLVLESIGATAAVYTKYEVIKHLKEYIKDRRLFDPTNPTTIHCENDILEEVFGCKEFCTENFCELLRNKLESVSDNSDVEQGLASPGSSRKRKRANLTDVSCSSQSSGACSPQTIPWCLGFIGRTGFESNDEKSDCSNRSRPHCGVKGYDTATTAIITDSEDDIYFPDDGHEFDRFSVEYEPPDTNSEDEKDDDDDDDPPIIVSSDEDPGADGGDEYDEGDDVNTDSDSEDAWECSQCKAMNHPMTRHCVECWGQRAEWLPQLTRTTSAPVTCRSDDNLFQPPAPPSVCRRSTIGPSVHIDNPPSTGSNNNKQNWQIHTSIPTTAVMPSLIEVKDFESSSRSSSSCSNTHHSCDSGICVSSCETDTEHSTKSLVSAITTLDTMENSTFVPTTQLNSVTASDQPADLHNACSKDNEGPVIPAQQASHSIESTSSENTDSAETTSQITIDLCATETAVNNESNPSPGTLEAATVQSLPSTKTSGQPEEVFYKDMCVICLAQPRNASIIHGRSGHQVCCLSCAEKLKAAKKKCPVCRRRIHFVIKNFL